MTIDMLCYDHEDAALPHLPLGFEVKKLSWEPATNQAGSEGLWIIAVGQFGHEYEVIKTFNGQLGEGWSYRSKWFKSIEDAKAAAQADFERRVCECIIDKPVDVAVVRRQALEEAATCVDAKAKEYEGETKDVRNSIEDKRLCGAIAVRLRGSASEIRALSTEPAQGEQWQAMDSVPRDSVVILKYGDKICFAEWWEAAKKWQYLQAPHSNSLASDLWFRGEPDGWMHLPAAPTTEVEA